MNIYLKRLGIIAFVVLVGIVVIGFSLSAGSGDFTAPTQFEVFYGTPYCVSEGILYRYEETGWTYAGYSEQIKQLVPAEHLCAVDVEGKCIFEQDLTVTEEVMPLTSLFYLEMARKFIALNQTEPFVEISWDIGHAPSALLEDGSILLPREDQYKKFTMTEKPVALSGGFILTQEGNVYHQSDIMSNGPEVSCIYSEGNITAISGDLLSGECVGLTTDGTVISWNTTPYSSFDITAVQAWKDVTAVRQGDHFIIALTKAGRVLYADSNKERTERIGNEFATWKNITNIAVSYETVYALASDGDCFSVAIQDQPEALSQ